MRDCKERGRGKEMEGFEVMRSREERAKEDGGEQRVEGKGIGALHH